jgi:hypothetical protein
MIEIELEVLCLTEEQEELQMAGIDIDFSECKTTSFTFYSISYLRALETKGYSEIMSDGHEYIIRESKESIKRKIKTQLTFKWN